MRLPTDKQIERIVTLTIRVLRELANRAEQTPETANCPEGQ